ncbi:hypothetical protein EJ04DRAFT_580169 [Polyplosphaeria fusca]|uniref:DUF6594 domain-containing protein n=1 Tax=Polyplosphaeria fusca TaxID=682080 RepID=A0A9P4QQZ3_9PLEO|nr:hypothetical protein EJ04DRAFT_580169 [Polyplosphaeria fusca]
MPGDAFQGIARDLIQRLHRHTSTFQDVAPYPKAVLCEKFIEYRMRILACFESEVERRHADLEAYMGEVRGGKRAAEEDEEIRSDFTSRVMALFEVLHLHCLTFQDIKISTEPGRIDPHFMDYYRSCLADLADNAQFPVQAPNGKSIDYFGKQGDPAPRTLIAVRGDDMDSLERSILDHAVEPFLAWVWDPLKNSWRKITCGKDRQNETHVTRNFRRSRITLVAKIAVCLVVAIFLTAVGVALYAITDIRVQIAVIAIFASAFCLSALYVGPTSFPTCTLALGFFQAMIFFVGFNRTT